MFVRCFDTRDRSHTRVGHQIKLPPPLFVVTLRGQNFLKVTSLENVKNTFHLSNLVPAGSQLFILFIPLISDHVFGGILLIMLCTKLKKNNKT